MIALSLLLATAAPQAIGIFERWGAFRGADRCYAIATPVATGRGAVGRPFASVAFFPQAHVRQQLQVRLSRPTGALARVVLSVGDRRFDLVARGSDAWAPDARTDRAIVSAIRSARSMAVAATDTGGRPYADSYALAGAPTAIDAAAVACAGG